MSLPQAGRGPYRVLHIGNGAAHRIRQFQSLCQPTGDGRGQCAARSVGMTCVDARRFKWNEIVAAPQDIANHRALAMTTPGDTSMVTASEVFKLASGGNARVDR